MSSAHYETLFHRHPRNPILTAADWPYPAHTVFNPGATRLADGTTLLLCRVEDRRGHSHLCAARSANGVDGWVDRRRRRRSGPIPSTTPRSCGASRTRASPSSRSSASTRSPTPPSARAGPGVALALTTDFRTFERYGLVMQPDDKDAALLPRRIDGSFALLHRPMADAERAHLDLVLAGPPQLGRAQAGAPGPPGRLVGRQQDRPVAAADRDAARLAHALPRRAAHGGRRALPARAWRCCDLEHPEHCLLRGDSWIFGPEAPTSVRATSATSPSRAATPSAPTATRSTCTTAPPTPASRWRPAAFEQILSWLDRNGPGA